MMFDDICALHTGRACNAVTREVNAVPAVDVFVAGFVCKSVSTANAHRGEHGECITEGSGQTGETFSGVLGYVRRNRPHIVICENVAGLLKRNRGRDPHIYQVRRDFQELGYVLTSCWSLSGATVSGCGLSGKTLRPLQRLKECWTSSTVWKDRSPWPCIRV